MIVELCRILKQAEKKDFDILTISLSGLRNFDGLTKLFSNLNLAKFLNTLTKLVFH